MHQRTRLGIGAVLVLCLCSCASQVSESTKAAPPTTTGVIQTTTSWSVAATLPSSCVGNPPTIPPGALYKLPLDRCAHVTVSTRTLKVGTELNVSGDSCTPGYAGMVLIDQTIDQPPLAGVPVFQQTFDRPVAGPDGRWSADAAVPMVALGPAILESACVPNDVPASTIAFRYANVPVTIESAAQVSIAPGTVVMPGSSLIISSATLCPLGFPTVSLVNPATKTAASPTGIPVGTGQPSGPPRWWPVTLDVSASTVPGAYILEASCSYVGTTVGIYEPVAVTVR